MIERSGYVSYANCGLPYYIGGTITDRSKLTLQTPESFRARFDIDVRVRQEAIAIDPEARTVTVRRLDDGSKYIEGYDKLILSPGARPVMPGLPGEDGERLFTLRTVEDTYRIADFVERERPGRVTVVGAGFIGLEMAENLRERGLEVTVVQRGDHVLPIFDADMAALLHNHLREHGVELLLNANVTGFAEHDGVVATSLADGRVIESDMVMLSIGVAPESTLAREAGLELGLRGSIKVDASMRTSDEHIYAVGDAVEVVNVVTEAPALIALDAAEDSDLLVIDSQTFGALAQDNIHAEAFTYRQATERFSDCMWVMQQVLFMGLDARLAIWLLDEVARGGSPRIAATHDEIARHLGSAREAVSRMLKYFAREGLVRLSRGAVEIVDARRLRQLTA